MNKIIRVLKYLIGWPLSLVSLFFIFKLIQENANLVKNFQNVNIPLLLIGLLFFILYFFLRANLWRKLMFVKGSKFDFLDTSYLWEMSEIKRYTPGNIWSFLSRADLFSKDVVSKKEVGSSIVDEAILVALSCFTISFFYISSYFKNNYIGWGLLLINIILIIIYVFNKRLKFFLLPKENPEQNFSFYLNSVFAFICFGFANYFSAVSVIYLDPRNLVFLISLFVFALLVGYLSIVTPMGLGVREGVNTIGLSNLVSFGNAGFISIFTRIIFIFAEMIFLGLVLILKKTKKQFYKIYNLLSQHKYPVFLGLFMLIYIFYFATASFLRYDNFFAGRFDLGNMDQTVWNTIHGRIFQMTDPNATNTVLRLNFHSDFILVLLSPFYLIWSNPKMLLIIQTVILSFGSIFIYLLSAEVFKNKKLSLVFSLVFLLNPSVQYVNLYDFHAVALSTTFLLGTFYFFIKKRYFLFLIFGFLSAICKEEIWVIVALFGLLISLRVIYENNFRFKLSKNQVVELLFGIFVLVISWLIFYLLIWLIIPALRGGSHFALSYYSDFGDTPSGVLKGIIINPVKTVQIIFSPSRLIYLTQIFSPLGFTSLLSPLYLIFSTPDFLINLLSSNKPLREIYYQYTSAITPFIFISSIYGVNFLIKRFSKITHNSFSYFLLICTLVSSYYIGPLPGSQHANIEMFNKQLNNREVVESFISKIPQQYTVSASNNLGAHLTHRINLYNIPIGFDSADMILFLLNDSFAQPPLAVQRQMVAELKNNKNYTLVLKNGDFVAFEKTSLLKNSENKINENKNSFEYSINELIKRSYKKSPIRIEDEISTNGNFKSYVISFNSDGLKEYALMNIPTTQKPKNGFPVLILNHGYIKPNAYDTINSYKTDSDYFANHGFLVIKPDYRGNGKSEVNNTALMRFAYPIDVLNLISSLENIKDADGNQVFIWSHSMGGEVTLETLEIASKDKNMKNKIKGAVLWAPVTDPVKWFSKSHIPQLQEAKETSKPYDQTFQIIGTPESNPKLWKELSPLSYLENIETPVLIQHGTSDTTVPYSWSEELNQLLIEKGKYVKFISYENDNHNLPLHWSEAVSSDVDFYHSLVK